MTSKEQAYNALRVAAERIGQNNYRSGLYKKKGYRITQEHQDVLQAMSDVLSGKITPENAMALLHEYDVLKQWVGK